WGRWNRLLYGLYWRATSWWPRLRSKWFWRWARDHLPRPATYDRPLLYLTWGRIGDTVLATAVTRHLHRLFERPVVMVGREEVEELVADHVECFLPFSPESWQKDERYRRQFLDAVWDDYDVVIADIHVFNGGMEYFKELIDLLPIKRKFVYEGYAEPEALAPIRHWPKTAVVISSLKKSGYGEDPDGLHVWHDHMHYMCGILQVCGIGEDLSFNDARPVIETAPTDPGLLDQLGLEEGNYVACQPISENTKKDYPVESWLELFDAFPDEQFVLLGTEKEAGKLARMDLANVHNLCGQTSLTEAILAVKSARMFVGIDSGLTHIAACLGVPTVCVSQNNNLGYFFPYPKEFGFDNLRVVHNPDYEDCAGCFTACTKEPIWKTYLKGSLCLRALPVDRVIEAVERQLTAAYTEVDAEPGVEANADADVGAGADASPGADADADTAKTTA
ncbi:MAG: glycosyltransferase family 9 protein, partial [Planctomycetota bacterium]